MPAHAFIDKGEVHAVYNRMRRVDSPHEDTHIILGELGRPAKLLEEGAAEYVHHGDAIHSWHRDALLNTHQGIVSMLINDAAFTSSDLFLSYPLAGSFVGFLMERYGLDAFKKVYSSTDTPLPQIAIQVYGKGLAELETEWKAFIEGHVQIKRMDSR